MSKYFSKIKIKENGVEIVYTEHISLNDGDVRNRTLTVKSDIKPHLNFFKSFQNLKRFAVAYMELTAFKTNIDSTILERFVVTSVSITQDTEGDKIQISINKELANKKVFSLTTPLIDLVEDDFIEIRELNEAYEDLLSEATEYTEGKNGDTQLKIEYKAA